MPVKIFSVGQIDIVISTNTSRSIKYGALHGSVLDSILFSMYMLPLKSVFTQYDMNQQFYLNDTQLRLFLNQSFVINEHSAYPKI